jgi:hypothetical protein
VLAFLLVGEFGDRFSAQDWDGAEKGGSTHKRQTHGDRRPVHDIIGTAVCTKRSAGQAAAPDEDSNANGFQFLPSFTRFG